MFTIHDICSELNLQNFPKDKVFKFLDTFRDIGGVNLGEASVPNNFSGKIGDLFNFSALNLNLTIIGFSISPLNAIRDFVLKIGDDSIVFIMKYSQEQGKFYYNLFGNDVWYEKCPGVWDILPDNRNFPEVKNTFIPIDLTLPKFSFHFDDPVSVFYNIFINAKPDDVSVKVKFKAVVNQQDDYKYVKKLI
jgi:hypothetical protein